MGIKRNRLLQIVNSSSLSSSQQRAVRVALTDLSGDNIEMEQFREALERRGNLRNSIDFNEICGRIFG